METIEEFEAFVRSSFIESRWKTKCLLPFYLNNYCTHGEFRRNTCKPNCNRIFSNRFSQFISFWQAYRCNCHTNRLNTCFK